ncbi:MAG: glycoside hydrolase family 2, partial [Methanomicrobia archaeon]|nr:glycoside hydrolase family 2 [Methanomicrobia archaeon]
MNHLLSKEGQLVSKDRVWQEYPRPDFVRQSYLNLNGEWDFAIQKSKEIPSSFELKILVPFAVESLLSGINHGIEDDDYLVYQR